MNRTILVTGVAAALLAVVLVLGDRSRTPVSVPLASAASSSVSVMLPATTSGQETNPAPAPVPAPAPPQAALPVRSIELAGQTLQVMVAETPAQQEQGLGGLSGLAPDQGMLFIFPQDGEYSFWMKDMNFSIDMIWLSASGGVVYMAENVSPATYPETFTPDAPARYVLELPAGWAKEYTVQIGEVAQL